jgi:hypothetical protein
VTDTRDGYRLRVAVPDGRGGQTLEPAADERVFATWRESVDAASDLARLTGETVVSQAVVLAAPGGVVSPPDPPVVRRRARRRVAGVIRLGPRAKTATRKPPPEADHNG